MLNLERIDKQAEMLALDISRITAYHAERLKHLYHNPAKQIYKLGHTDKAIEFAIVGTPPADIAAEIWAAYELHFGQ